MSAPRMSPAALGLRAMASAAALTARPWPSAASPAANASANPAAMMDQRTMSAPPGVEYTAASCA